MHPHFRTGAVMITMIAAAGVAAPSVQAQSATTTPPPMSFSGELDGYYQYQFSNPASSDPLPGRIYAFRQNTPTLRLAWLDAYHDAPAGGFGYKVSLAAGDAADRDVAGNPSSGTGEAQLKSLAQFYATYKDKSGATLDVGKYLSPYGYDTTEANLNYNYTLTDATYLVPNYVFGAKLTVPLAKRDLSGSVYVVNSIEEGPHLGVEDEGGNHDVILRLNYTTPNGKFNYIPAVGFGKADLGASGLAAGDAAPAQGNENLVLWDNWLTYHVTPKVTIAGEYVYRSDSNNGGDYNRKGDGYGVYYRVQVDPRNAIALRYSELTSNTAVVDGVPTLSTTSFGINEETATYEYKVTTQFTTRFEVRHDYSNNTAAFSFPNGSSPTPDANQYSALVAGIYTL